MVACCRVGGTECSSARMGLFEGCHQYLHHLYHSLASGDSQVKCLPAMQETWVQFLGREDPMEKKMKSTPVLLPRKFHGQRSLVGYRQWDHKKSDRTEQLHSQITGKEHSPALQQKIGLKIY